MLMGFFFLVLASIVALVLRLEGSGASVLVQCGSSSVGAVTWLAMRRGTWKTETLQVVDVVATFALCSVFLALGWGIPIWGRLDLLQLVCITDILGLRAFLVPSTTRRTAVIGSVV